MSYESIDALQRALADQVFAYARDRKKAAGRALGTFVEIITYYLLQSWELRNSTTIERQLPEFANPEITHNVEYALHPILAWKKKRIEIPKLPLSAKKLASVLDEPLVAGPGEHFGKDDEGESVTADKKRRDHALLTSDRILRNCCTLEDDASSIRMLHLDAYAPPRYDVTEVKLHPRPFAIFECKRVGAEEGMKKGPQTIEKAKQGAYVARSASSLQKIRARDGMLWGALEIEPGRFETGPYQALLRRTIDSDNSALLRQMILTVGVVSNHGNWFTSENQNKEVKVLAHSYDWLLFLSDAGLVDFIKTLLLSPEDRYKPVAKAFAASYGQHSRKNRFTKVGMDLDADEVLRRFFDEQRNRIEAWFGIISPSGQSLDALREELGKLATKNWAGIYT